MQKRIYLDSVTIIYLLENTAKKPAVLSVLSKYPNHTICSSALALMECLVKPLQNNNQLLVAAYDLFPDLVAHSEPPSGISPRRYNQGVDEAAHS
jgi:hypothetical protein